MAQHKLLAKMDSQAEKIPIFSHEGDSVKTVTVFNKRFYRKMFATYIWYIKNFSIETIKIKLLYLNCI